MPLKHTILGFLNISPKTGYDLQKKIGMTISHFWTSTQSQIYRTLGEMTEEGLIVSEVHYQDEKPNKKVYSITSEGKEELLRWLSNPLELPNHRNPFLIQLFFSGNINSEAVISNLSHYRAQMEERHRFLLRDETRAMLSLSDSAYEKLLFSIIHNNGLQMLQSEIDWVDESIKLLKEYAGKENE